MLWNALHVWNVQCWQHAFLLWYAYTHASIQLIYLLTRYSPDETNSVFIVLAPPQLVEGTKSKNVWSLKAIVSREVSLESIRWITKTRRPWTMAAWRCSWNLVSGESVWADVDWTLVYMIFTLHIYNLHMLYTCDYPVYFNFIFYLASTDWSDVFCKASAPTHLHLQYIHDM